MDPLNLTALTWRKSTYSNGQTQCVQVAGLPGGRMAIRDSKHPDRGALIVTPEQARRLIRGITERPQ